MVALSSPNSVSLSLSSLSQHSAAAALALAASAAADPITIPTDPLAAFSEMPNDYRNWASVLSQVRERERIGDSLRATARARACRHLTLSLMLASPSPHLTLVAIHHHIAPTAHRSC